MAVAASRIVIDMEVVQGKVTPSEIAIKENNMEKKVNGSMKNKMAKSHKLLLKKMKGSNQRSRFHIIPGTQK